ncbi:peptidylprolyl isomerase [Spongorhabdus nitratireducens]
MKSIWLRCLTAFATLLLTLHVNAATAPDATALPRVELDTSAGKMVVELYPAKAPITVKNFLDYVNSGYYDGVVFHRVIRGFMVQTGGFEPGMKKKDTKAPIKNEANNGLKNERGTLSMARTNNPDSATAQFFINEVDNPNLDYSSRSAGYAVFGKVVEGLPVLDKIAATPTKTLGFYRDVPEQDILIKKAQVIKPEEKAKAPAQGG